MGADRINVVEGLVEDITHARLPNVPGEMGVRSELALNKWGLVKKVAVAGMIAAVVLAVRRSQRET